jgi:hypothetical protein
MQRVVRIAAGASVSPTLAPNDVEYHVTPTTECQPCRLIRVTSTTNGMVQAKLTWSDVRSTLHAWVNGQMFPGDPNVREVIVDVPMAGGEIVLYVGKIAGLASDYVPFTLSTTLR